MAPELTMMTPFYTDISTLRIRNWTDISGLPSKTLVLLVKPCHSHFWLHDVLPLSSPIPSYTFVIYHEPAYCPYTMYHMNPKPCDWVEIL
jgi:hypothetical protein